MGAYDGFMRESNTSGSPRETPLFIYDGNCAFCTFWIEYWKTLTGGRVAYAPFQEVAAQFPQIPPAAFQAAAQFIDREGIIFSGAEAVVRSLAQAPDKKWMLWCYENVPGVAPVLDRTYKFIARHRQLFYQLTLVLRGDLK